jgi:hypothetical protein
MSLTADDIKEQSRRAYNQWATTWREHAIAHSKYEMKSLAEFEHVGIGKAVVCVANGYSLELEIETLKKYQHNVDIICCDKSLGHLLDHGITPTYCIVCDAKVSYEKYLEKWKDQLKDIILFQNICANPKWAAAEWKDRYFFGNKDVLGSEKEFMGLAGCPNVVPAGTNVSNALVVFLTQSDNEKTQNFFGYDKILLLGFDYAWREGGNYYAFDKDGGGKFNYMRHMFTRNIDNRHCFTSNNLAFSAKWLEQYIGAFKLPVVQCSRESVLPLKNMGVLAEQMQYSFNTEDSKRVISMLNRRKELLAEKKMIEQTVLGIGREHYYSFISSL